MNQQKRHWCGTVWPKHIGLSALDDEAEIIEGFEDFWEGFKDAPNLRYAIAQIERAESGNLHIQLYTEWKRSLRRSEVYKILPANLEPRFGSRDDARDYCRVKVWRGKDKGQVKRLPEIGEWRAAKPSGPSPKQRALDYLKKGMAPADILRHDPDVYFTHFRAIEACYNLMMKAGISIYPGSEEE
jgi:hypothetical protein